MIQWPTTESILASNSIQSFTEVVFPALSYPNTAPPTSSSCLEDRVFLAPRNDTATELNKNLLNSIPSCQLDAGSISSWAEPNSARPDTRPVDTSNGSRVGRADTRSEFDLGSVGLRCMQYPTERTNLSLGAVYVTESGCPAH